MIQMLRWSMRYVTRYFNLYELLFSLKIPDSLRPSRERSQALWRGGNVCDWPERRTEGYNSSYGIESKLEKPSEQGSHIKKTGQAQPVTTAPAASI
jgi:hypothetical protein